MKLESNYLVICYSARIKNKNSNYILAVPIQEKLLTMAGTPPGRNVFPENCARTRENPIVNFKFIVIDQLN